MAAGTETGADAAAGFSTGLTGVTDGVAGEVTAGRTGRCCAKYGRVYGRSHTANRVNRDPWNVVSVTVGPGDDATRRDIRRSNGAVFDIGRSDGIIGNLGGPNRARRNLACSDRAGRDLALLRRRS